MEVVVVKYKWNRKKLCSQNFKNMLKMMNNINHFQLFKYKYQKHKIV